MRSLNREATFHPLIGGNLGDGHRSRQRDQVAEQNNQGGGEEANMRNGVTETQKHNRTQNGGEGRQKNGSGSQAPPVQTGRCIRLLIQSVVSDTPGIWP